MNVLAYLQDLKKKTLRNCSKARVDHLFTTLSTVTSLLPS